MMNDKSQILFISQYSVPRLRPLPLYSVISAGYFYYYNIFNQLGAIIIQGMDRLDKITSLLTFPDHPNYQKMKHILAQGLFSLEPTFPKLTKSHLALLSTPGVADVCLKIVEDPSSVNRLTIRGRSIALVTRGLMFDTNPRSFLPVMDWMITQIKFYANVDCYPFVIRDKCLLSDVLSDLSNTYCGALVLDCEDIPCINHKDLNFFALSHWKVCNLLDLEFTNAEISAYILANLISKQFNGAILQKDIVNLFRLGPCKLNSKNVNYDVFDENRISGTSSLEVHEFLEGKIGISLKHSNIDQLKQCFTESNLIRLVSENLNHECMCSKLNVILTDGTSILGLGNIGPVPGLPVMEAKSMIFKLLGNVNVVPVCINARKSPQEAMRAIMDLIHLYKAINLQDIKAPECFTIERGLQEMSNLPVFHDDQHGTSIASLAGLINSLRICDKQPNQCRVVIAGAGAAGINIAKIIHSYGIKQIIACDTQGIIYKGRQNNMNCFKDEIADFTNKTNLKGTLSDAIVGADVFIGVSGKDIFKKQWIRLMKPKPIIFALANPIPEISQEDAAEGGCYIYASGKNNRPNQISNSLVYPGIFRAINQLNIRKITPEMEIAVAKEIAGMKGQSLSQWEILPTCLDTNISLRIAQRLGQFI